MTPFRSHVTLGLVLLAVGIVYDFLFVEWKLSDSYKTNPVAYINSFAKQLYDLTKFYLVVLGFLNIALALLIDHTGASTKVNWAILGLTAIGSILIIAAGMWYANAGPSFEWETRCTVLTVGLLAIVLGLGLELFGLFSGRWPTGQRR